MNVMLKEDQISLINAIYVWSQSIPSVPIPPPSECLYSIPGLHGGAHYGTKKQATGIICSYFQPIQESMNFQLRHLTVLRLSGNGYKRPFFKRKIYVLKRTRSGSVFRGRGKQKPKKTNEKWHPISILKTINMPYWEKASKPIDRNSINDILAEKHGICGHALYSGNMVSRKDL